MLNLTLSLRQSGAVSEKIFDCFFLVYWVHLNVIYQILDGWFKKITAAYNKLEGGLSYCNVCEQLFFCVSEWSEMKGGLYERR